MKVLFAVAIAAIFAYASPAAAQTVFPPLVSGTYELGAQAATPVLDLNGDPMTAPTKAISLHKEEAPTAQIACVPVDENGISRFSLLLVNDGLRNAIRGRAHENDDCTGLESVESPNRAIVFFNGMDPATLRP